MTLIMFCWLQSDSGLSSSLAAATAEGGEGVWTGGTTEGGAGGAKLHHGAAQDRQGQVGERERVLHTGTCIWGLLDLQSWAIQQI